MIVKRKTPTQPPHASTHRPLKPRVMLTGRRSNARLTLEEVAEIRATYGPGVNVRQLAAKYGISIASMHAVIKGTSYKEQA